MISLIKRFISQCVPCTTILNRWMEYVTFFQAPQFHHVKKTKNFHVILRRSVFPQTLCVMAIKTAQMDQMKKIPCVTILVQWIMEDVNPQLSVNMSAQEVGWSASVQQAWGWPGMKLTVKVGPNEFTVQIYLPPLSIGIWKKIGSDSPYEYETYIVCILTAVGACTKIVFTSKIIIFIWFTKFIIVDINECDELGTCDQGCVNKAGKFGKYKCYCMEGFKKKLNSTTCKSIGEYQKHHAIMYILIWLVAHGICCKIATLPWVC